MKSLLNNLDKLLYERLIKALMFSSRLGRKSTLGYADSGINFDHIYQNKAKGYNKFGVIIDRILLSLPACKATRERFITIKNILEDEVRRNISKNRKTRIVDLASGPARYLVQFIPEKSNQIESLCLDLDSRALNFGKKISGDSRPILYRKWNALRLGKHLKNFSVKREWKPNVIMASGFYEYQPDDVVQAHFSKTKEYLEHDGLFLGVLQFKNPNRKLIEKVGIQKSGKRWVLFYRSPETLHHWMVKAGYSDIRVFSDKWKHYIFCLGRKP